jgi:hypothetical protein
VSHPKPETATIITRWQHEICPTHLSIGQLPILDCRLNDPSSPIGNQQSAIGNA